MMPYGKGLIPMELHVLFLCYLWPLSLYNCKAKLLQQIPYDPQILQYLLLGLYTLTKKVPNVALGDGKAINTETT